MRIVNKGRFLTTLGLLAIIIFLASLFINKPMHEKKYVETYKTVYISKGETLWSIAREYKKPNQDIRDYIYELERVNNMNFASLYDGQEFTIIIYEEVK